MIFFKKELIFTSFSGKKHRKLIRKNKEKNTNLINTINKIIGFKIIKVKCDYNNKYILFHCYDNKSRLVCSLSFSSIEYHFFDFIENNFFNIIEIIIRVPLKNIKARLLDKNTAKFMIVYYNGDSLLLKYAQIKLKNPLLAYCYDYLNNNFHLLNTKTYKRVDDYGVKVILKIDIFNMFIFKKI